ncbi:DUF2785 domain-containing protein [Anaerobacillus alkaliphilus]|uniref:DUF2785 domain-containing protein n=1 Tax=Anaerobacillus alkaliphilus TaxID=1548597 RepID=A0A4Q0VX77_9BACI|nr:DUF2785 domain-containing protein [Anaerobacillus alkaliphilus]RXJ04264.1 DUF2785 domain-containing protein [Anaerobacillus alkaliphilus]
MNLKHQLEEIRNQSGVYQPTDDLIELMLNNIGTNDSELRDKLIYSTFSKWVQENSINSKQAYYILDRCLSTSHLFFCIGEENNDSVFKRSFSSLLIACLMNKDHEAMLLTEKQFANVFDKSVVYLNSEKDTRGFVDEKGWAHAIAHGADLLDACVKHPMYSSEFHKITLETISSCLFHGVIFIDDEDERLVSVINTLIDKGIEDEMLERWIDNISKKLKEIHNVEEYSLKFYRTKTNIMNFYKTLYFSLPSEKHYLRNRIEENIQSWKNS